MESMMLIEVLDAHGRIQERHRQIVVGGTFKIGRSVACDIVLDDAYAAAEHTILTLLDDGRVSITDMGSRNGTRLNGKLVTADVSRIEDGELIVGRTHLRIRTLHTQLPPERLFRRDLLQRHKTFLAALGLALTLGFVAFFQWLAAPEQLAPRLLMALVGACVVLGLWVGMWTLITRIGHGAWNVRIHVAIAANTIAIGVWSSWIIGVISYAIQWRLTAITIVIGIAAIVSALHLHLVKATYLAARTTIVIAIAIPLMLATATGWLNQQAITHDVNRITLGPTIYPPKARLVASTELNDYLVQVNSLKREAGRKRQQSLAEMPLAEVGQ
jgi:hypothetical protein